MSGAQETADDYGRVIAVSGRWRVIRCRDDLQFIVQKRRSGGGSNPWKARAYIYTVTALQTVLDRPSMGIPPDDRVRLMADLPRVRAIEAV